MEKKESIIFCSFGKGYYAMNKRRIVNNDYEKLAFIDNSGKLKFLKSVYSIPGPALLKIEHFADTVAANYTEVTK